MTTTVNVHKAKTQLSELLARVEAGEEIVIARAGKPVARMVAVKPERHVPQLGTMEEQITYAPGWDEDEDWDQWLNDPNDPLRLGE